MSLQTWVLHNAWTFDFANLDCSYFVTFKISRFCVIMKIAEGHFTDCHFIFAKFRDLFFASTNFRDFMKFAKIEVSRKFRCNKVIFDMQTEYIQVHLLVTMVLLRYSHMVQHGAQYAVSVCLSMQFWHSDTSAIFRATNFRGDICCNLLPLCHHRQNK